VRGAAYDGTNVQAILQGAQFVAVSIDYDDVVLLDRQVLS
jgi:hypothetical protein